MDINTIFYFPSSLTFDEYSNKLDQGEISERTIVFADAQKAIYKGGKKYGGTSVQEFHNLIDTLYDDSWISDEINGIKGDVLQSIARLDQFNTLVNNVSSRLDTEIQERDNNIQAKVEELMEDAAWLQDNFPQGVTQWDAGWNQNLEAYLQTVGYWTKDGNNQTITQWSKLRQDLNSIETSVNSLKVDGNLTQALTTSIQQLITDKIASLQLGTTYATVERVGDVEKVLEWMYSGLESSASGDITFSEMSSMAKNTFISAISDIRTQVSKVANGDFVAQTELASKVGDTIAAMLLQSSSDNALAGMSARLDTVEQNTGTLSQNVASLVLGVTGSSSTADLATVVANKLAGFTTSADINSAKSEIYSAIGAKDSNDQFISIASLKTQSDDNHSTISGIATRVGTLETNQSGFVASANLDSAVAEMFASSGNGQNATAKANVVALVKDNKASLELTADDVNITANDINLNGYLTGGSASFKGDVEATSFTTGSVSEIGIGVMSGEFDESLANTNKAYFAYDSSQGGITMWYYQNNEWKRLNLADSAVLDSAETFQEYNYIVLPDTSIDVFPSNPTVVTVYYNRVTGKYYSAQDTTSSLVNGMYFQIVGKKPDELDSYYTNPNQNYSVWNGVCTILEHKSNGTVVNSGLAAGDCSSSVGIRPIRITNGVAETSTNYYFTVGHVISDIYLDASGNIISAVCAPVFMTPLYSASAWSTTQSNWHFGTENNGNTAFNSSTKVLLQNGRLMTANTSVPYTFVDAKRSTLQECLNFQQPEHPVYASQRSTRKWTLQQTVPVKYPGDSGYIY